MLLEYYKLILWLFFSELLTLFAFELILTILPYDLLLLFVLIFIIPAID